MILSSDIYCQEFDCVKYYKEYCKNLKSDSLGLPNYTAGYFYSGNRGDSSNLSIPDCINDLDAFCSGVKQALEADNLSIRQIGAPEHVLACSYKSYENYGIRLVMTGDLITDGGIFDENAGFNFIMKQRILDSLGLEIFRKLGKKDSNWIEFDDAQMRNLSETISVKMNSDSIIFLKIDEAQLTRTEFENLEGVIFTDELGNVNYSYSDILKGIKLSSRGDKVKTAYLILNFEEYSNPRFCKNPFNMSWRVPIRIK